MASPDNIRTSALYSGVISNYVVIPYYQVEFCNRHIRNEFIIPINDTDFELHVFWPSERCIKLRFF